MMPVADAVRGMLVAIALLVIRSWICGLVVFGQLTCQPPMSDIRTMSPDDRACDATAPCRQVQAQCARRSPTRAIVSMPSMHRQRQPAARARSPCCASGPSRSADAPQEPATNVCITSEGQLLIIRTVTKFNRPRDIAGIAKGFEEGRIAALLTLLRSKFGVQARDAAIAAHLRAATPAALEHYLERVLVADKLAAVFQD